MNLDDIKRDRNSFGTRKGLFVLWGHAFYEVICALYETRFICEEKGNVLVGEAGMCCDDSLIQVFQRASGDVMMVDP